MKRCIPFLAVLLAVSVMAGCDNNGPDEPNAAVFSRELDFDMDDASVNGNVASVAWDMPEIRRSVVEDGAVLVFFREQDTWTALPYTYAYESSQLPAVDFTVTLGFAYEQEFLEVFYELSTDEVSPLDEPDRRLKVVIIDALGASKADIDLRDYEQVKRYYGLPD